MLPSSGFMQRCFAGAAALSSLQFEAEQLVNLGQWNGEKSSGLAIVCISIISAVREEVFTYPYDTGTYRCHCFDTV
jgi:hypothetical protein